MAAIKGQPAPKPSQLTQPVPNVGASPDDALLDQYALKPEDQALLDQYAAAPEATQPTGPTDFPGRGLVETTAEWLPTMVGMAGAGVGLGLGGPAGALVGASAGAMAGQGYRQFIENNILGKPSPGPDQELMDVAQQGALGLVGEGVGLAAMKGAKEVVKKAPQVISKPMALVQQSVNRAYDDLTKPLGELITKKATTKTIEQSGDAVKGLLVNNIKGKYAPFVEAYSQLDEVGRALPLQDESRIKFMNKVKDWALEDLGGDHYRMVDKFNQDLLKANNGAQFQSVVKQIGDAARTAYQQGATEQATVLKSLKGMADDFMEMETTKLAGRIKAGKATPQESALLQQLIQARGIQEEMPGKYAKQLASDYLKSLKTVKGEYRVFREFLEDVSEQTKVKGLSRGPKAFLEAINEVPSEKLVERMFDPKNARALRVMQAQQPEVFQEVAQAKVTQLLQKASPDGVLDMMQFRREVFKLPEPTRNILFSKVEQDMMKQTLDNPKLARLDSIRKHAEKGLFQFAQDLATLTEVSMPKKMGRKSAAAAQLIGRPVASPLVEAFGPDAWRAPEKPQGER